MQLQTKISPMVYVIPFFVMFAVIGVALFAAKGQTDIRSHASNDAQKKCAATCTQIGGSAAGCINSCPKIIDGSMSCETAAAAVGAKSPMFLTACNSISPKNKICQQTCQSIGDGETRSICMNVCHDVSTGAKTCTQACAPFIAGGKAAKSFAGSCTTMCAKIPVSTLPVMKK